MANEFPSSPPDLDANALVAAYAEALDVLEIDPGGGEPMTPTEERKQRDHQALELRRAGATYDQIRVRLEFNSKGAAYKSVQRARAETGGPELDREAARRDEVDRLDRMLVVVWPKAMKGDLDYLREARQISRLRGALLGLFISPQTLLAGVDESDDDDKSATVVPASRLQKMREEMSGVHRRGASS